MGEGKGPREISEIVRNQFMFLTLLTFTLLTFTLLTFITFAFVFWTRPEQEMQLKEQNVHNYRREK